MSDQSELYLTLSSLAQNFVQADKGLPAQEDVAPSDRVVCFGLMGANLGIALEDVTEILEPPACTRLPRVKPWVIGLANLRGRLLPVINFAEYLGGRITSAPKHQRVLVVELLDSPVGLLVDEVHGMRNFAVDTFQPELPESVEVPAVLVSTVDGGYVQPDTTWALFRPALLLEEQGFMDVAA